MKERSSAAIGRLSSGCFERVVVKPHAADAAVGDILEDLEERQAAGRKAPLDGVVAQLARVLGSVLGVGEGRDTAIPAIVRSHAARRGPRAAPRARARALHSARARRGDLGRDRHLLRRRRRRAADRSRSITPEAIVQMSGAADVRGPTASRPEEFWAIHDGVAGFESVASLRQLENAGDRAAARPKSSPSCARRPRLFRVLRLEAAHRPASGRNRR